MNPIISIIVPVFNAQTYLVQTIESILAQSFVDFELILVNDGSMDASVQIMAEAAIKDGRTHVFEQKNAGVSVARNRGLESVRGRYFMFVDADDLLHEDCLKIMYQQAQNDCADMVECGLIYFRQDQDPEFNVGHVDNARGFSKEQSIEAFFRSNITSGVCCRLYDTSSFAHIRFPQNIICAEDALYAYECLIKAQKFVILEDVLYGYRQHSSSVMASYNRQKIIDVLQILNNIYTQAKLESWFLDLQAALDVFLINHALNCRYIELLNAPYYDWEACSLIRKALKQDFGMTAARLQQAMPNKMNYKTEMIFLGPEWLAKYLFAYRYKRYQKRKGKTH